MEEICLKIGCVCYLQVLNVEISQKLGLLPIKGKSETIWHVDRGGNLLGDKNYMERQAQ